MTTERDESRKIDAELDAFFEAAREHADDPSPELLARVLADGYAAQDARAVAPAPLPEPARRRRGRLAGVLDAVGGWPAMAGLVTATAAGVWIGYNPPAAIDTLSQSLVSGSYAQTEAFGLTMDSSLPDLEFLLTDS